jgi:Rieske 2Fe-2S family protein
MTAAPLDESLLAAVVRPVAEARTLPGAAYADPQVFEWERRHFLAGSWVCVGRAADTPGVGDQRAVTVAGTGVLLVRDETGALRGWFNTCRHRGHELLEPGNTRRGRGIRCPYHDWVYGLGGECRATPRFGKDGGATPDPADFPLVPVRLAEWHGWVFANVSGTWATRTSWSTGTTPPGWSSGPGTTTRSPPTGSWWWRTTSSATTAPRSTRSCAR